MKAQEQRTASDVVIPTERRNPKPRSPKYRSVQRKAAKPTGVRSGTRTGTTPHFAAWKAEGAIKTALQKLRLDKLAATIDDPAGMAFGILFTAGGYRSVWDIKSARRADLLAVENIGPARLKHVEEYLGARGVELEWAVS